MSSQKSSAEPRWCCMRSTYRKASYVRGRCRVAAQGRRVVPIIGATKERHVIEAAKIVLTTEEVARLEQLADATGIDTRGGWEHSME